jgi:hypothetical protein
MYNELSVFKMLFIYLLLLYPHKVFFSSRGHRVREKGGYRCFFSRLTQTEALY